MMVFSVATMAMALTTTGLMPATPRKTRLSGAPLPASCSTGKAVTAMAAMMT